MNIEEELAKNNARFGCSGCLGAIAAVIAFFWFGHDNPLVQQSLWQERLAVATIIFWLVFLFVFSRFD